MLVLRGRTSAINKPDDKSDIDSVLHSNLMFVSRKIDIPGSTTLSPGSSRFQIWGRGCPEVLLRRLRRPLCLSYLTSWVFSEKALGRDWFLRSCQKRPWHVTLTSLQPVNWLVLAACEFLEHKSISPNKKRKLSGLNLLGLTFWISGVKITVLPQHCSKQKSNSIKDSWYLSIKVIGSII